MREELIKSIEEKLNDDSETEKSVLIVDVFLEMLNELIADEIIHIKNTISEEEDMPDIRKASLCYEALSTYIFLKDSLSEPKEETVQMLKVHTCKFCGEILKATSIKKIEKEYELHIKTDYHISQVDLIKEIRKQKLLSLGNR